MRGYDQWKLREEPLEDVTLYSHCGECHIPLRGYFEEVSGLCQECEHAEQELRQAWLDDVDAEEAA